MRTDIQRLMSSDEVGINNAIRGESSRRAVEEDWDPTRHIGGKVGKVLTLGKG